MEKSAAKNNKEEIDETSLVLGSASNETPVFIYVVTILSAVGGFLFGYDTGVVSGAIILLRDYFSLSYIWQELVVSVTIVAAWFFSIVSGIATDRLGRKPIIIFSSFVFTVGALLMGLSVSKNELIIGRFVVGIGIGLSSMTVPMYIGEVAPAEIRGRLLTINNWCITFGQFSASVIAGIFSDNPEQGWRYMVGLAAIPSVIQFFGFLFMPESPRWLILKKKYTEAYTVLSKIRSNDTRVVEEFEAIKVNCLEMERELLERNGNSPILLQVLRNRSLRRALLVGCSLQIFQQLAGINTVMYYSATIIQMSGVKETSKVIWLSCATAGMNCICSLVAFFFIEKVGRRLLTLVSLAGVIFSLCFLAVSFQIVDMNSPNLTVHNEADSGTQCMGYSNCAGCISNEYCGYCFTESPNGPVNGSCLLVDTDYQEVSIKGMCNGTHHGSNISWAYNWCPSPYSWMTLLGLLIYLLCFAPGMGNTPWTVNSEIYPVWARSTCYSTATSFNWLFNFLVSISFLSLTQAITKYGAFWLYAGISLIGFVFLYFMLPETKGRTLEEVEGLFSRSWWQNRSTERETVQYVHIRGINHSYTVDSDEDDS